MQIPYISKDEQRVIELIAQGKSSKAIVDEIAHARRLRAAIRHKTGIPNTSDARFSREYLEAAQAALSAPPQFTSDELASLSNVAETGMPRSWTSEALAVFQSACRKAAIFTSNPGELRTQCRAFLAFRDPVRVALTYFHKQAMRLYADGLETHEIAALLTNLDGTPRKLYEVEKLISAGCKMLKATSCGRGVQRRLVGIALNAMENASKSAEKDPLDDY